MPPEIDPRALIRIREARSRSRLRAATRSLVGLEEAGSPARQARAGVTRAVRGHPLVSVAAAAGAGFALAPKRARKTDDASSGRRASLGGLASQLLVAARLVTSVTGFMSSALGGSQPTSGPDDTVTSDG